MLRQAAVVTLFGLGGIPHRLGSSVVVVVGIMAVVGVLMSVLTMARSLEGSLLASGSAERAIVLRGGAASEAQSVLPLAAAAVIANAAGIARTAGDKPAATADLLMPVNLARRSDGALAAVAVRGVSELAVRPEVAIVAGRAFVPGVRELVVGRAAQAAFNGLDIGGRIILRDGEWPIVGVFASGTSLESGMLADAATLLSAFSRTEVNSVTVRLESPDAFDAFKTALTTNPALSVDVLREPDYYAAEAADVAALFFFVTYVVGAIMASGAVFGALNTMYSAVSARTIEIATLRALGFGAAGVVTSVLAEALLLALLGALLGAAVAWGLFNGDTISLGGQERSLVTPLRITWSTLAAGITCACAVGLLGGLLPAIRAARLPVAVALRPD
ncbi:MAG TPA: ABC transporter permease [Gammaproteobacteria bacterium]|nr:ABC transporter permease [Gammaproteobacteria bacterium]